MKANELMIGDWVKTKECTCRVSKLFKEKMNISCTWKDFLYTDVEPIPLTEEILKANGFEDCGNRYDVKVSVLGREDSHDTFSIAKDWVNPNVLYFRVSMMFPRLHYVHELQHALRLCGLAELADNFKIK